MTQQHHQRTRISRDDALMQIAELMSERSTCLRLQVGALVAREGRILVTGYNGAPSGVPHCSSDTCGERLPCIRAVHAEANCMAFAAKHGIQLDGAEMYTTDSPCINCAHLIINAGIACVTYMREYRDKSPIDWLHMAGIKTRFHEWVLQKRMEHD
jgi:dCMP deaminase